MAPAISDTDSQDYKITTKKSKTRKFAIWKRHSVEAIEALLSEEINYVPLGFIWISIGPFLKGLCVRTSKRAAILTNMKTHKDFWKPILAPLLETQKLPLFHNEVDWACLQWNKVICKWFSKLKIISVFLKSN